MAGSLAAQAGRNSYGLRGEFPSRHLERGLDLLTDALIRPAFPANEVARAREEQLQQIHTRDDHPSGQVFRLLARSLYGQHPYGLDLQGEEASVKSFDSARLQEAHRQALLGGSLVVSLVGDVDPEQAIRQVTDRLGSIPAGISAPVVRPALSPPPARTVVHQELAKAQTHMVIGFLGARVTDPDRHPLEVLSSVLSGQGGRLFLQLRDKQSLAYSVSSFSVEGLDPGYFGVYIGTSPEKLDAAVAGMLGELQRVVETPISAEELDRAQQYLVGSHAIGMQKNASRAAVIALDDAFGLGAENYLDFEKQIMSITREQVLEAARRVLKMDKASIAVVGPRPPSFS
jgi:zinc protease